MWMKLAWLMPKQLVYWCAIRLGAHATTGKYATTEAPSMTFMDAVKRWGAS